MSAKRWACDPRSPWMHRRVHIAHFFKAHRMIEPNTSQTITLDTPLVRGEQVIEAITLRKPQVGELRGTSLSALVSLEVDALQRVLPRISTPTLTEADVAHLDPADLVQLGGAFARFLLPKALPASMDSLST